MAPKYNNFTHKNSITDITFDNKFLYSCGLDKTIAIWDRSSGKNTQLLQGHTQAVTCIKLIKDYIIASGGQDSTLRFWNSMVWIKVDHAFNQS